MTEDDHEPRTQDPVQAVPEEAADTVAEEEGSESDRAGGEAAPGTGTADGEGLLDEEAAVAEDEYDVSPQARHRRRSERQHRYAGFDAATFIGAVYVNDGQGISFGGTGAAVSVLPSAGWIPHTRLRTIARSYRPTACDARLAEAIATDRLVFLQGHEYGGRATTATAALCRWAPGPQPRIGVLAPEGDFVSLADRIHDGAGYVVDATGGRWVEALTQTEVNEVWARLDRVKSALVVLVDTSVLSPAATPYTVRHTPPEPRGVCDSALSLHLPEAEHAAALRSALRYEEVRLWVEEMTTPEEAVALAGLVAAWWQRGGEGEPRAAEYRHRLLCGQARRLLSAMHTADSPTQQSYVLATAVLDRHELSTVVRAAESLREELRRAQDPDSGLGREVFSEFLQHRMRHVRWELREAADGAAPRRVVRLRRPRLAGALLDVVWSEFDTARGPLLKWLRNLCLDPDTRVRISAAQALGRLAGTDFAEIKRQVLLPLADSDRAADHQAASWLLEKAFKDGVRSDEVRSLLRAWSRSGKWTQAAVALRSYTTEIAREHPEEALRGIRDVVLSGRTGPARGKRRSGEPPGGKRERRAGRRSPFVVLPAFALAEMYADGRAEQVVGELIAWMRMREDTPRQVPEAFARIVAVTRDPGADAAGGLPERYDLLERLAEGGKITVPAVAALWCTVLLDPQLSGSAWDSLAGWDASVSAGEPGRDCLEELLAHMRKVPALTSRIDLYTAFRDHYGDRGPRQAPGRP
ncbi:hypothetical protein ACOALZ_20425 [Nocardiopsis algeriensis]|uniref:hypothetical protein n=1 Tax=Nocardiopsis algeriensis TaxID=1478215 RepID=UPI003B43A5DC